MKNSNFKILVAEDSEDIASLYKSSLEFRGYTVIVTNDGKAELEIYEKELKKDDSKKPPFDLIISDNSMPEINGLDAGKKILDLEPEQKFLFITGETDLITESLNVDGINIHVEQKPFNMGKMLDIVENMCKNLAV